MIQATQEQEKEWARMAREEGFLNEAELERELGFQEELENVLEEEE